RPTFEERLTRRRRDRLLLLLYVVPVCIIAASLYGILNDQVTVTLSPEYFSKLKHYQFLPTLHLIGLAESPLRVQAVVVGVAATWWVGLLMSPTIWLGSVVGGRPVATYRQTTKAIGHALLITATMAALGFLTGWFFGTPVPSIWCVNRELPIRLGRPFAAVGWAHGLAYLGGFFGTIVSSVGLYAIRPGIAKRRENPEGES
ncbi:MAG: hypothetical protein HY318_07515, partial [Armatimonadetes bacterium]|nr:hypothetical protein [Armatimonadota bacterium]